MSTRSSRPSPGAREVTAGGLLWLMLLIMLLAAYGLPELGSRWPSWW